MSASLVRSLVLVMLVQLCASCATTKPQKPVTEPVDHVELDPLVLKAGNGGVVALQARPLFKEATKDYSFARYDDALRKFLLIIDNFPESRYAKHAHFNAGLAAMRLERWDEAVGHHLNAREALAGSKDEWDALVQVTHCYERLQRWKDLRLTAHELLTRGKVNVTARVEVRARLGIAHYEMGELALAERAFKLVLKDYKRNISVPALERNSYVSRAQYLIGEIYRGLFASIRFRLPVETMKRDLTDKSSFFLKGQSAYLRCVRLQNKHWSVAAGYRLGKLYEDFYQDMMDAEVPSELDDDDKKVYYDELRKHVKPLVVRAIEIYERNLGMSDRLGTGGDWAKKTQASLDRMRNILRREFQ